MENIFIKIIYNTQEIKIMANNNEYMKDIFKRFFINANITKNTKNFYFLCEGVKISEEMKINEINNNKNELNILVYSNTTIINEPQKKYSKLIICPECEWSCEININDYKINLDQCDNGHNFHNILIEEFNNTQIIDETKIKCNECNNLKDKAYNGQFYFCCKCNCYLCPLCRTNHNNNINHIILDYEIKNYRCKQHGERYILYCKKNAKILCDLCEIEHNRNHEFIYYKDLISEKDYKKNLI